MDLKIRRATPRDAGAAADLWLRARHAAVPVIHPPGHTEEEVRSWFATRVVEAMEMWIAEGAVGTAVGLLVLEGEWLAQLYVEPGLTGRGIGTALLDVAKRERPTGLRLWTFQANARARTFYERHGFTAADHTEGDNEEQAPDVLYVWGGDET